MNTNANMPVTPVAKATGPIVNGEKMPIIILTPDIPKLAWSMSPLGAKAAGPSNGAWRGTGILDGYYVDDTYAPCPYSFNAASASSRCSPRCKERSTQRLL